MEETHANLIHIAVVEDNPADVELLRLALNTAAFEYELSVVDDGAAALRLFSEYSEDLPVPDDTILDLNLPKYDGLEILESIRSNPRFSSMPVAILSSSSSPRDRARIEAYGMVTYITKPPDLDRYLGIGPLIRDFIFSSRSEEARRPA